jgi:hypothetical protein
MYNGDTAKADEVLKLAKAFQAYINTGEEGDSIRGFLR